MPFKPLLDSRTHRRMADQGGVTEPDMIGTIGTVCPPDFAEDDLRIFRTSD
jgi:hypothetical protein